MKILFLNAPYTTQDSRFFSTRIPLGQFHVASSLRDCAVKIVNCHELTPAQLLETLERFQPDHIGITLYAALLRETKQLVALLRSHSKAVVSIGGPMATVSPAASLYQTRADIVFRGEAEKTFPAFLEIVGREKDFRAHGHLVEKLRAIEGLAFLDGQETLVITTPQGPRLSASELEAGELDYSLVAGLIRQDNVLQLATSRGCPNNCVFCSKIHGSAWRGWSAAKILRELARIRECSGRGELPRLEVIAFEDDDFLVDRARALELSRGIVEGNYPYDYIIQSNPDTLFYHNEPDGELLDALKAMRTKIIYLGTDSLQSLELRRLGKPVDDVEKIRALSRELCNRGILTSHYLILANLETTASDFLENIFTASLFRQSFNQSFYVNLSLIPVVGSRFFRRVVEEKVPYAYLIEPAEGHPEFNYPVGMPVDPADPLLATFYQVLQKEKGLDKNDPLALFTAFGHFLEKENARSREGKSLAYPKERLAALGASYEDMKKQLAL